MSIPDVSLSQSEGDIPDSVAGLLETTEAPEALPPFISFRRYNEDECEVDQGEMKHYALSALRTIKDMGAYALFTNAKHVVNDGAYKDVYRGLEDIPDVAIQEIRLEGKIPHESSKTERVEAGRIFCFKTDNIVSMVAIRANHYETDKTR